VGACGVFPDQYQPRKPKASPLYRLLDAHFGEFKAVYEERFEKRHGFWRPVVDEVVTKFLACGDLHYGFARIKCEDCGEEYLRPYSCKCTKFCPSCAQRKTLELAIFLEDELLRPVAHRHWVWSIPKILRLHYMHHRELLPRLSNCAWSVLVEFVQTAVGRDDVFPGGVFVPQTFGGLANANPHVHALISEECYDRQGNAYPMPEFSEEDLKLLEELFACKVFGMMVGEGMISEQLVEKIRSWRHWGFSIHCETRIEGDDAKGRQALAEYIARAPFSMERMTVNEDASAVLYRGEHFHPSLKRNFDVSDPLEWLARITAHIPDKGAKGVIYYGAYGQAWRGREKRQGILPAQTQQFVEQDSDRDLPHRRQCRQRWAALLKRVWNVDALKCPKCGGHMRLISCIDDPQVIRRILEHLGLYEEARSPPVEESEVWYEPDPDYVPWEDDVPVVQIA